MTIVVPTVTLDLRIVPGCLKPSTRVLDFEYTSSLLRAGLLLQSLKRREHICVHRNVASVTILCFCKVYLLAPEIHVPPDKTVLHAPDWAIAFKKGSVKHIYFIAETKGAMTSMELRKIEQSKIDCARKFFFKITSDNVKYGVVDGFETLMKLVQM